MSKNSSSGHLVADENEQDFKVDWLVLIFFNSNTEHIKEFGIWGKNI